MKGRLIKKYKKKSLLMVGDGYGVLFVLADNSLLRFNHGWGYIQLENVGIKRVDNHMVRIFPKKGGSVLNFEVEGVIDRIVEVRNGKIRYKHPKKIFTYACYDKEFPTTIAKTGVLTESDGVLVSYHNFVEKRQEYFKKGGVI
jgi:hypothetical protein